MLYRNYDIDAWRYQEERLVLVMKTVDNRLRMIRLIEKIERNRKLADQMHVKDVSEFKKQSNANK